MFKKDFNVFFFVIIYCVVNSLLFIVFSDVNVSIKFNDVFKNVRIVCLCSVMNGLFVFRIFGFNVSFLIYE